MKVKVELGVLAALAIVSTTTSLSSGGIGEGEIRNSAPRGKVPRLLVGVDPRVELLSVIFRLAGNPEYNRGRVNSYTDDMEAQFGSFRDHAVVRLAVELRNTRGVSYDACMGLAIHLSDAYDLKLRIPLDPWPESLDRRWTPEGVTNFLAAARQFVKVTRFQEFFVKHHPLYETAEGRMRGLMESQGHLEWFQGFFGEQTQETFGVVLGMLNGGSCYGPHFRKGTGPEELFCVLGVWQTDSQGLPEFTNDMLDTVVHEFAHSYANPLIDRHEQEFHDAGETLFALVAERMRSQAYGQPTTMLRESLVRACVVRYILRYKGNAAAQRAVQGEVRRGFLWMQELYELLGDYEGHRDQYPALESFAPRLVSFFKNYAVDFATKQAALDAKRPKVVSMFPVNGATDVDPGITEIRVKFDRPMKDHSWSMCGGGSHFPEGKAEPYYDAERTSWTMKVNLKPNWSYEFGLNCQSFDAFRSEEGVPLEPVAVTFMTGSQTRPGQPGETK